MADVNSEVSRSDKMGMGSSEVFLGLNMKSEEVFIPMMERVCRLQTMFIVRNGSIGYFPVRIMGGVGYE